MDYVLNVVSILNFNGQVPKILFLFKMKIILKKIQMYI